EAVGAVEFLPAVEALHAVELLGLPPLPPAGLPGPVVVLEGDAAAEPGEQLARLREVAVDDLPPHRPARLVLPRVAGQVADPPAGAHVGGQEVGPPADVRRGG